MKSILIVVAFTEAFVVSPALAHAGIGQSDSFAAGIAHPLGGADHILAMAMVGLWSVLIGSRATWLWPTTFLAAMLGGFVAAVFGLQLSFVESTITVSIVVLALLIALGVRAPLWLGGAAIGLFGFFHGHAHGTEAAVGSLLSYAAGFALATAGLHGVGVGVGFCARGLIGRLALRATGRIAALVGG
jgi:urease accessory protein